jgi:hypothetical protein
MANFLLQSINDENALDIEYHLVKEKLNKCKYQHSYKEMSLLELKNSTPDIGMIPIGTIEYVTEYLKKAYGIIRQNPIEIPEYLRTDEFLKRDYNIVTWDNIPRKGRYFIKNASKLKDFSYLGEMEYFITDEIFEKPVREFDTTLRLSKNDLYVISSDFRPKSEYRVYVISGAIEAIVNYNGDCCMLPDISLLNKVIEIINFKEDFLKSYTIDVMVNDKGTAIIEIHNFTSIGLYTTLLGDNLLYAYKDGIDYLLKDNKIIRGKV